MSSHRFKESAEYEAWRKENAARRLSRKADVNGVWNNMFTVVVYPSTENDDDAVSTTIASLAAQDYLNIEAIVLGGSEAEIVGQHDFTTLRGLFVEPLTRLENLFGAAKTARRWRGDYIMIVPVGTTFDEDAFRLLNAACNPDSLGKIPDVVICDFDAPDLETGAKIPSFVPGWDPDLIQCVDYIRSSFIFSPEIFETVCQADRPKTLHDWLCCLATGRSKAEIRHLAEPLVHLPAAAAEGPVRIFEPSHPCPVSGGDNQAADMALIIPNKNQPELLKKCLGVLDFSTQFRVELIIVDNASSDPETLAIYEQAKTRHGAKIVPMDQRFNFSRMINLGVAASRADVVLLLNNDVEIRNAHALEQILAHARRPEVGVVGTQLSYADGTVQHAGVILREFHWEPGSPIRALHVMRHASSTDVGYMYELSAIRNYQAVTGAVLATRREIFDRIGGFDEVMLPVEFNDIDYCLKAGEAGYRVICLPLDEVYHYESSSRGVSQPDPLSREIDTVMSDRWRSVVRGDKFRNRWVHTGDTKQAKFPWSMLKEYLENFRAC